MAVPVNDTSCSPTSTCPIQGGATTNGTIFVATYNPDAPVVDWLQKLELATICICNSLTCIVIISRIWYRWLKLKRIRGDDMFMAFALLIMIPYTVSQIGTNVYGSGLHFANIRTPWRRLHWHYELGWVGYWIVVSAIKMSVCLFFLQLLNQHLKSLRYCVLALCAVICSLGTTMTCSYFFGCQPFLSNFLWSVDEISCINYDIFRWLWISVSVPIDMAIMSVPIRILNRTSLRQHEKRILRMVFCATLLGTVTCVIGIFGAFETRTANGNDAYFREVPFVMMCDIEILMYALGASFPVLSRYIVQRIDPGPTEQHLNFTSWARQIPDFFTAQRTVQTQNARQSVDQGHAYAIELHSRDGGIHPEPDRCDVVDDGAPAESFKSGPSEPYSMDDLDLEKCRVQTTIEVSKD